MQKLQTKCMKFQFVHTQKLPNTKTTMHQCIYNIAHRHTARTNTECDIGECQPQHQDKKSRKVEQCIYVTPATIQTIQHKY